MRCPIAALAVIAATACPSAQSPPVVPAGGGPSPTSEIEATSLLGKPLVRPPLPPDVLKQREEALAAARRDFEANPNSADAIIWLGRRLAYLGRYREAIDVFTDGIRKFPDDARIYRHRGHR